VGESLTEARPPREKTKKKIYIFFSLKKGRRKKRFSIAKGEVVSAPALEGKP